MGLFFLLAAMAPTALAGAMEVGATRFAAGEYARAVDAPRLRLRPPADYRAKPPQKRYSVTVLIGKPKPALPLPKLEGAAGAPLPRSEEHTSELKSLMRNANA